MRLRYELSHGDGAASSLSGSTAIEPSTLSSLRTLRGCMVRLKVAAFAAEKRSAVLRVRPNGGRAQSLHMGRRHCLPVGVQQLLEREAMQ
jgi:hypothetical protein